MSDFCVTNPLLGLVDSEYLNDSDSIECVGEIMSDETGDGGRTGLSDSVSVEPNEESRAILLD